MISAIAKTSCSGRHGRCFSNKASGGILPKVPCPLQRSPKAATLIKKENMGIVSQRVIEETLLLCGRMFGFYRNNIYATLSEGEYSFCNNGENNQSPYNKRTRTEMPHVRHLSAVVVTRIAVTVAVVIRCT